MITVQTDKLKQKSNELKEKDSKGTEENGQSNDRMNDWMNERQKLTTRMQHMKEIKK